MANIINEVKPGNLITAALWNSLVMKLGALEAALEKLSGSVPTGKIKVPDVFGQQLKDATAMITKPSLQLALGFVVDAFGKPVNPDLQASAGLIVIGQMPGGGMLANPFESVNLAVSASPSAVSEPPKTPKIKDNGFTPNPVPAGTELKINGENFAPSGKDNQVFFDGTKATQPSDSSGPNQLLVVVPMKLPNGPKKKGDPTNTKVTVLIKTPNGEVEGTLAVAAPLQDEPPPFIATITPVTGLLNQEITITGTGFSPTKEENRVTIGGKPADGIIPASADETTLKVIVPQSLESAFDTAPKTLAFDVIVTTNKVKSNTKPTNIRRLQ